MPRGSFNCRFDVGISRRFNRKFLLPSIKLSGGEGGL